MNFPRASGILLHPTSLPGRFGIGDLGGEAFRFIDFLAQTGQTYWQILPLGPTGYGNSPYSSDSAFAGNSLLISPELLAEDSLLPEEILDSVPKFSDGRVDFGAVRAWKNGLLNAAFEHFRSIPNSELNDEFDKFTDQHSWWLDDYAIFRALKAAHNQSPWYDWEEALRLRDGAALDTVRSQLSREIDAEKFRQFLFFRQWLGVKTYANENGIYIIGDIPIFLGRDSADVWCNQNKFKLNEDGSPKVVAGVPPDYFSKTGQLWGNPIYDWDAMLADNFSWWTARIAWTFKAVDIVRLDHFIGFVRNWEVPGDDKTAENGEWMDVPGRELFAMLQRRLGELPIIAEDLGALTPEIEDLRDDCGFPGMRILHYAFGGDAKNRDLPHNYPKNCVAYTGTHDNDTTVGWYKKADKKAKAHCRKYLNISGRDIHLNMVRALFASVADTAIVPLQDILGLASDARMNTPGSASGNWEWRFSDHDLSGDIAKRLVELTEIYGRSNQYTNSEDETE